MVESAANQLTGVLQPRLKSYNHARWSDHIFCRGDCPTKETSLQVKAIPRLTISLIIAVSPTLALAQVAPPASPGLGASTSAAKTGTAAVRHYNPHEIICHYTTVTGTRFPIKACQRRADWDQLAQDSRDALSHEQVIGTKCEPKC